MTTTPEDIFFETSGTYIPLEKEAIEQFNEN
jgi:hypothetical protein